jgi:site-specific DNA-methyltransferase (adenine-specific)
LKPAHEPIVLARKPLVGTVAENVLRFGVGGLNIDGCRVGDDVVATQHTTRPAGDALVGRGAKAIGVISQHIGRWPANLIHDGSDEVLELFPETAGGARPAKANKPTGQHYEGGWGTIAEGERINFPAGSAARFFYCAKASKKDRNEGLDHLTPQRESDRTSDNLPGGDNPRNRTNTPRLNHHPTVKPTELMRYLCRLITPPNGVILDPFTGSGSTGKAAILEHFQFIGIEQDPDYITIAQTRIQHAEQETQP